MPSSNNKTSKANKSNSTSKPKSNWQNKSDNEKSVDDLLCELAYLRAENDYLKKLDALIYQKQQTKSK